MAKSDKDGREDRKPAEKPISLRPLGFEEAVRDLLRVDAGKGKASAQKKNRD